MITSIPPEYLSILTTNQLDTFDRIWHLKMDWIESPNQKRGGWSGVGRIELKKNDGTPLNLFIKKQERYFFIGLYSEFWVLYYLIIIIKRLKHPITH
jgi:hypothetical protein